MCKFEERRLLSVWNITEGEVDGVSLRDTGSRCCNNQALCSYFGVGFEWALPLASLLQFNQFELQLRALESL